MNDLEHDGLDLGSIAVAGEGRNEDLHFSTWRVDSFFLNVVNGAWQDVYGRQSECEDVRMWTAIKSET